MQQSGTDGVFGPKISTAERKIDKYAPQYSNQARRLPSDTLEWEPLIVGRRDRITVDPSFRPSFNGVMPCMNHKILAMQTECH